MEDHYDKVSQFIFSNLSSKFFFVFSIISKGILFEISSSKILKKISFALLVSDS